MKKIALISAVALACGLAACAKPAPESAPAAATPAPAAAPSSGGSLTSATGNYLKTTTGGIGAAKDAAKLYEKSEAQRMTLDGEK